MKCEKVIAWLLGSASPEKPPKEVIQHLERCFRCRQHWQRLVRLESVLAAGRGDAHTHGLEDFLRRHGFFKAAAPARPHEHEAPGEMTPMIGGGLPKSIREKTKFVWWFVPVIALIGITAGVMVLGLVTGLRHRGVSPVVQAVSESEPSSRTHVSATGPASHNLASVSSSSAQAHGSMISPAEAVLDSRSIDTAAILARARGDVQIVWQLLDNVITLTGKTQAADRIACVGTLTCQLGEEALRLAERESAEDMGRFVDWFGRSAALLVRVVHRSPEVGRAGLVRSWQSRLSEIATSARKRASASPAAVSERLQQLAWRAERCGTALLELASDTLGLGQEAVPALASRRVDKLNPFTAAGRKDADLFDIGANESCWLCVLYRADENGDAETEENPTAYLLLCSLRMELINLVVACSLRLAEENDPLLRIHEVLDLTEAMLRALAVVSSVGSSPVCKRLACYLNAMILATLEANWPERDLSSEAASPERRKSWHQAGQRLADLLAVLQLNDQEAPVQPAWLEAMREVQNGIEALQAACERGAPQPPEEPQKAPHGAKPLSTQGQVLPGVPKPVGKPYSEKPGKPEKAKPLKPPFKPSKPFPERFKDLKELWRGTKR